MIMSKWVKYWTNSEQARQMHLSFIRDKFNCQDTRQEVFLVSVYDYHLLFGTYYFHTCLLLLCSH